MTHKLRSFEATSDEMYCVRVAEALIEDPRSHDCPAVAKLVGVWVFAVASLIDDNVGALDAAVLGDIRLGPSGRKRRRVDPEVKSHVLSLGSGGGCSIGAGVAGKLKLALPSSTTVSVKLLYLSAKRAACLRLIEDNPESIACASTFDAARVGKPAVDLLMHLIWDPRLGKTFVAAPREPRSRHPTPPRHCRPPLFRKPFRTSFKS